MSSFLHFFPMYNLVFSNFSAPTGTEERRRISTSFLILSDVSNKKSLMEKKREREKGEG